MDYSFATKEYNKETMAKVVGRSLPVSEKFSVEICNFIRHKTTNKAKEILKSVAEGKKAIPFKKFNKDLSHKKKIGPGRYPKKPAIEIIKLLESVEANAQFKGLNTSNLEIKHICAHLASRPWHHGRQRRRKAKRTNIEIIVEEKKLSDAPEGHKKTKGFSPESGKGVEKAKLSQKESKQEKEKKEITKKGPTISKNTQKDNVKNTEEKPIEQKTKEIKK